MVPDSAALLPGGPPGASAKVRLPELSALITTVSEVVSYEVEPTAMSRKEVVM